VGFSIGNRFCVYMVPEHRGVTYVSQSMWLISWTFDSTSKLPPLLEVEGIHPHPIPTRTGERGLQGKWLFQVWPWRWMSLSSCPCPQMPRPRGDKAEAQELARNSNGKGSNCQALGFCH
jgi:hypothetical protein